MTTTIASMTPAQKGKTTKALKHFVGRYEGDDLIAVSEMIAVFVFAGAPVDHKQIDEEMTKRGREAARAAELAAKHEAPKAEVVTLTPRGMTLEQAEAAAKELLGPDGIVWSATHDSKGREFTAPRFRFGIPTTKPDSYLVEQGRLMIGTGATLASAYSDTKKRIIVASDFTHKPVDGKVVEYAPVVAGM